MFNELSSSVVGQGLFTFLYTLIQICPSDPFFKDHKHNHATQLHTDEYPGLGGLVGWFACWFVRVVRRLSSASWTGLV